MRRPVVKAILNKLLGSVQLCRKPMCSASGETAGKHQPTPGMVLFAGYGSTVSEPHSLRFNDFRREADGFSLKFSYLFRL